MLDGVRVLDLTDERGWLAGKILGDLGADVIKVEPPGGDPGRRRGPFLGGREDPERCLRWLALNTSKRGVVLDLGDAEDARRFRELAAGADVVLESFAPGALDALGLGYDELARAHPRLVYCSLTPFGVEGPRAGWRAHDLVLVAMGGNLAATGDPDRPPVRCSLPTAYYHTGPEAALGVVMALCARENTGRGDFVDVSMHEAQLQSLLSFPGQYALHRRPLRRTGGRSGRTREIWRAKDGWITYGLRGGQTRLPNLIATVEYMAECGMAPDWLKAYDWAGFNPARTSREEVARLEEAFGAFFASRTMRELYGEALKRRILLAPCNDAREILEHEQLRFRELFARLDYPELGASLEHPGFFAKVDPGRIALRHRAPRIGEHQEEVLGTLTPAPSPLGPPPPHRSTAPDPASRAEGAARSEPQASEVQTGGIFDGLRILELGSGAAGPVAARYFAEQGATVVRIESARRPDFLRLLNPDAAHGVEGAPMFILLNPNKRSVALNLKEPRAVEVAKRLVGWADVVAQNFSPGVMERWGLDRATLQSVNPGAIVLANCLFGQTGPQRTYPGFGGQGSAIAGFNHLTGWPDREAHGPFATITDSLSPRYVAVALAAALLERRRTGRGRWIDVSQIETGVYSLSELIVRYSAGGESVSRCGNRELGASPHGVYPCRGEDRWLALAVWSDAEWAALRAALGDPEWARDARFAGAPGRLAGQDEIEALLGAATREHDAYELAGRLQAAGVEAGPVQTNDDLLSDPQLAHRGHFVELEHPRLGAMQFEHSGLRFASHPRRLATPGPLLGQHTREVLEEALDMERDEIDRLIDAKVLS